MSTSARPGESCQAVSRGLYEEAMYLLDLLLCDSMLTHLAVQICGFSVIVSKLCVVPDASTGNSKIFPSILIFSCSRYPLGMHFTDFICDIMCTIPFVILLTAKMDNSIDHDVKTLEPQQSLMGWGLTEGHTGYHQKMTVSPTKFFIGYQSRRMYTRSLLNCRFRRLHPATEMMGCSSCGNGPNPCHSKLQNGCDGWLWGKSEI